MSDLQQKVQKGYASAALFLLAIIGFWTDAPGFVHANFPAIEESTVKALIIFLAVTSIAAVWVPWRYYAVAWRYLVRWWRIGRIRAARLRLRFRRSTAYWPTLLILGVLLGCMVTFGVTYYAMRQATPTGDSKELAEAFYAGGPVSSEDWKEYMRRKAESITRERERIELSRLQEVDKNWENEKAKLEQERDQALTKLRTVDDEKAVAKAIADAKLDAEGELRYAWQKSAHEGLKQIRVDWEQTYKFWREGDWPDIDFRRQVFVNHALVKGLIQHMPGDFASRWEAHPNHLLHYPERPLTQPSLPAGIEDGSEASLLFRQYAIDMELLDQFIKETTPNLPNYKPGF